MRFEEIIFEIDLCEKPLFLTICGAHFEFIMLRTCFDFHFSFSPGLVSHSIFLCLLTILANYSPSKSAHSKSR